MLSIAAMREVIGERIRPALHWPTAQFAPLAPVRVPALPLMAWRAIALRAALLWLATRVALAIVTYVAVVLGPIGAVHPHTALSFHTLLWTWQRWDSDWYLTIAQDGYWSAMPTAFFPLYPLLVHIPIVLANGHVLVTGLLISNLAALAAFIGLALLTAGEVGFDVAPTAVRLFVAYPLAFFLAAPYSESLFVALAVFSLLCARRGHWLWSAVCAFLASLTHLTRSYATHAGWRSSRRSWRRHPPASSPIWPISACASANPRAFSTPSNATGITRQCCPGSRCEWPRRPSAPRP